MEREGAIDQTGVSRLGVKAERALAELDRLKIENATRVACRVCGVPILPDNLVWHESLHDGD